MSSCVLCQLERQRFMVQYCDVQWRNYGARAANRRAVVCRREHASRRSTDARAAEMKNSAEQPSRSSLRLGPDKILAARQLARLVAGSARLDSARFNFFTSRAESLARYFNEPARVSLRAAHELKQAEDY